jgi:cell wall-associated NlpC family hydrolase
LGGTIAVSAATVSSAALPTALPQGDVAGVLTGLVTSLGQLVQVLQQQAAAQVQGGGAAAGVQQLGSTGAPLADANGCGCGCSGASGALSGVATHRKHQRTGGANAAPVPGRGSSKGAEIVRAAKSQIGTSESKAAKYVHAGGGSGPEAWCGDFVEWVYQQAGYDKPPARSVPGLLAWAKSKGKLTKQPTAGDAVMFDWDKDGTPDHVGIVKSRHGGTVQTIEGNTSISSGGDGVAAKERPMSDVLGFVNLA